MQVVKRDGRIVPFQIEKIENAILKAFSAVYEDKVDEDMKYRTKCIALYVESLGENDSDRQITIEEIQDVVEKKLMESRYKDVARVYVNYRYLHDLIRTHNTTDATIQELIGGTSEYWNTENSNKNARLVTTQRDYIAGITSVDIADRLLLPPDIVEADHEGIIHFHDKDYMLQKSLHNCELVNLEDMLQNGTVINEVLIEKPHRLITATTIATQIITAVTSSSYGGCTITLSHLAPFVRDSFNYYVKKYRDWGFNEEQAQEFASRDLKKEISDAVQTFNYQCNSMTNTNGQAPFLSVFMYINENMEYQKETALLIEEFLKQRIQGFKNKKGVYITPAFPKLLYCLDENNVPADSEYRYLTDLAESCTAKRMVPDYISAKMMRKLKVDDNGEGQVYPCMGCRSFLTTYVNPETGKAKYYGRFNQGVVTINLVDLALSSGKDFDKFWQLFDKRTELCHRALQCKHERLELATSDVAPILWRYGALARLPEGEPIHKLLHGNYSTLSLGYAGLFECVKYMTGQTHSGAEGEEGYNFAIQVMQALNDKCAKWRAEEDIGYSLYGSPIESTTNKFAQNLQRRFGMIEGITDQDYITNSYHVNVREEIDPFKKLEVEAKFQELSPGGAISYIECSDLTQNLEAVDQVVRFIYDNIMYAELNTKSDYCQVCGYDGEIKILDEGGKLIWECPQCNNRDTTKMNVARRTCG